MIKRLTPKKEVVAVTCYSAEGFDPIVSGEARQVSRGLGPYQLVVLFLPGKTMTFRGGNKTAEVTDARLFLEGSGLEDRFSV